MALDPKARDALRAACVARGWRDIDLAHAAGVSESSAWKVLRGKPVTSAILGKIAEAIEDSRPDKATMRLLAGEIK